MIRPAKENDAYRLTKLSIDSKRFWGYPDSYFEIWDRELCITPEYIRTHPVFVFETTSAISGYYALVRLKEDMVFSGIRLKKGVWLDHMFVASHYIGTGIGTSLFRHLVNETCIKQNISRFSLLADPHSRGFYERMGCRYVREIPSTIAGRTTPLMVYNSKVLKKNT